MDSDLAWVNGKSGRQSWRYADAFRRSIISEAIYHLFTIYVLLHTFYTDCRRLDELFSVHLQWWQILLLQHRPYFHWRQHDT